MGLLGEIEEGVKITLALNKTWISSNPKQLKSHPVST